MSTSSDDVRGESVSRETPKRGVSMKDSLMDRHHAFSEETRELGIPNYRYQYRAGVVGGLLGGLAMAIPALLYGFISNHGPWYPVNLVAATVMPRLQSEAPAAFERFDPTSLAVGLVLHLAVATGVGLLFAILLPTLPGPPQLWALLVGPLLWLGATSIILPTINPVMSNLLDWPSFALANIVYGLVMGLWVAHTEPVPV